MATSFDTKSMLNVCKAQIWTNCLLYSLLSPTESCHGFFLKCMWRAWTEGNDLEALSCASTSHQHQPQDRHRDQSCALLVITVTAPELVVSERGGKKGVVWFLAWDYLRIHQLDCPAVRKIPPNNASETVLGQIRVQNLFPKNGNKWMSKVKQEQGKEIKYFLPNIHTAFKHFQLSGFPELDVVCLISNSPFPSQQWIPLPNVCPDSSGICTDNLQLPHAVARVCPGICPDAQRTESFLFWCM